MRSKITRAFLNVFQEVIRVLCVLGRRNALRASEAVRATGVMVNPADYRYKKSPVGLFCNATRKLLLLRIHFLDMIVHNRSELHWRLDVWN